MTEPLALALGLATLILYRQNRIGWAALTAALTALTKEVGLVLVAGACLHALWTRRWRGAAVLGIAGAGTFALWAWIVGQWLSRVPGGAAQGLGAVQPERQLSLIPFYGVSGYGNLVFLTLGLAWIVLPAIVLGLIMVYRFRRFPAERAALETWLLLAAVAFIAVMPPGTFQETPSAVRYAQPFLVAAVLYLARVMPRRLPWALPVWAPTAALGLLLAFTAI